MHGRPAGQSGQWFAIAGLLVVARAAIELAEPAYYDHETLLDYVAATLTSVAWLATAVALARWWPARPAKRASFLILLAAFGIAVSAVGNFLEDVVDVSIGELLFTYGGMFGAISILITAGSTFPDGGGEFLSGSSLIMLGYVIHRHGSTPQSSRAA